MTRRGARLRPEEEVVLLCAHAELGEQQEQRLRSLLAADGLNWMRLWQLADVDRLVRRTGQALDWARVIDLAQAWSVTSLLYFALWRVQVLFQTPAPGWVLGRLRPAAWRGALVDLLAGPWAVLWPPTADSLRANRFRLAYCAMLPPTQPRDRGLQVLPDAARRVTRLDAAVRSVRQSQRAGVGPRLDRRGARLLGRSALPLRGTYR